MNKENFEKATAINRKISQRRNQITELTAHIGNMKKNIQVVTDMAKKMDNTDVNDYDRNYLFVSDEDLSNTTAKFSEAMRLDLPACDIFNYIVVGMLDKIADLQNEINKLEEDFAAL